MVFENSYFKSEVLLVCRTIYTFPCFFLFDSSIQGNVFDLIGVLKEKKYLSLQNCGIANMNPKMLDQPLSLFPILFYLFFFFSIHYFNWKTRIKNFALFCLFDPIYIFFLYTLLHIGVYGAYNLFIFNNFFCI